ncbi:hypothetical protein QNA24_29795 [Rhodococcus qingshengii]|uniref:hypothetical protein n=1 Tax=Rhodococcus TaxID=1827 RepID=UPI001E3CD10A|nr:MULTISPECIES: hypothetical protein [Rhodococcus]MCD2099566.1 hypothetical protein [Rhodococcus rhodochrous]MCD2123934.1 hypothetical protein [Rhodococcus rhodochrous]MCQ4136637.1 hypothetical protein [Rhodococcus rhodochrous]MDJ0490577.1 hypothetical protein [Rhodococcus qingshengii]
MNTTYSGNSHYYLLDRLSKTHPELVSKVESGEMTAHAAAVAAGLRPRTLQMRLDRPESFVKSMRRNATPEFIAEVARLLREA